MKKSFYFLYSQNYLDFDIKGMFEGSAGLNVQEMFNQFRNTFDERGLGKPAFPKSSMKLVSASPLSVSGGVCSGSIDSRAVVDFHALRGGSWMILDTEHPSYPEYLRKHQATWNAWDRRRKNKLAEIKKLYPGRDEFEMFLSLLKQEHGFKGMEFEAVNV